VEYILILFSYLLGSIPTGLLLTKAFSKQDPRQVGSRNIGTTNIYRAAGKTLAIMTLAGDALKGFIPVSLALYWHFSEAWVGLAAVATFLGHLYPVFLHFKGGKGVATGLGIFFALCPLDRHVQARELMALGHRKIDWMAVCADLWKVLGDRSERKCLLVERLLHLIRYSIKW